MSPSRSQARHNLSLGLVLFAVWLLLSGHYTGLLISIGVVCVALVVFLAHRMEVADHEGHPVHLTGRALGYWSWLGWQIIKSNLRVARKILFGGGISPVFVTLSTRQDSELGQVIYANSITLTPGTVSVKVDGQNILVHALETSGAEELQRGEMDRRVKKMMD